LRERLRLLGCRHPTGLALLPTNLEQASTISELRQVSAAATVKTLLRNSGITLDEIVDRDQRPPYIQNNALEWIAPTIFVSWMVLSENPQLLSIGLGMIANYATDFLRGMPGGKSVKLDIIVESKGGKNYKRVAYDGPPEGLKDLAAVVKSAADD
jgi:hypothetical protein